MNNMGINSSTIDKLALDIYNYDERINKTLNEISNVVDQTRSVYSCAAANNYRNRFSNIRANFNVVNKNIQSYAEDIIKLKAKYSDIGSNSTQIIRKATIKMEDKVNW